MIRGRVLMHRDDGAVTLVVAVLMVAFCIIAASTIDFGQAYVTKRTLTTSADAAALAAAQYYGSLSGSCTALSSSADPAAATQAQAVANAYMNKNFPGATAGTITAQCSPDGKQLWVSFSNSATNNATFGQFAGVSSITTNRGATADVYPAQSVGGALPYALCFTDVQKLLQNPSTVQKASYPSSCGDFSGNWYSMDCPEDSGNTDSNNLAKFCKDQITSIDATDGGKYSYPVTSAMEAYVASQCNQTTGWSSDCLRGNAGNIGQNNIVNFWQSSVLGQTVVLPVVYDHTISSFGSGKSAKTYFPIVGFLAAKICGYHWGGTPQQGQVTTAGDSCVTDNTNGYAVDQGTNSDNYILLIAASYQYGGSSPPSQCQLGDSQCDFGVHAFSLIK